MYDRKWKKAKLPKNKIKKEDLNNLKVIDVLKKFYLILIFVAKNDLATI